MQKWFECKVKYDKMMENGVVKTVTEPYLVDALSFTEAEARIIEEMQPYINGGEFLVTAVRRMNLTDIFYNQTGDRWYKVKTNFITIDEKTAVEKKTAQFQMVQASEFSEALKVFMEGMKDSMADFEIASITETMIMDVFQVDLRSKAEKEQQ
ncbi:MAG: DUF4494 domain-containing protein [Muribaculaceae bacterium]|nr:DUF4494 domain-containing protein [Muribaculaceae bacterium]